jgi:diadenosine tetraphosphate (Ap4A) HIT family hydrolase
MSTIEDCPFCQLKDHVLLENELAQAFLSNPRIAYGHFLVTPKRHVEAPWELSQAEIIAIFNLINQVEQKLIGKVSDGCDVRQNYKPFLKQTRLKIDHIHYHVIPRTNQDRIFQVSEIHANQLWENVSQEEQNSFVKLFAGQKI